MDKYLELYVPLVDFIADFLGQHTEVVLHNLNSMENSIYKIRNGNISGRKVGDPITDLVVKALKNNDDSVQYRCNYLSLCKKNGHKLKCATYYIRNHENQIIGAFCINMQIEHFIEVKDAIENVLKNMNLLQSQEHMIEENIGMTLPEMIDKRINLTINNFIHDGHELSQQEKLEIVSELSEEGIFLLKGTVSKVAKELGISEPTLYKYLQKMK